MEKQLIYFSANDQILTRTGELFRVASNKVAYIEAHFDLGENWTGYDLIRAVWKAGDVVKPAVLNSEGVCVIPAEVLIKRSNVYVNLVGSTLEGTSLIERLTTYPEFAGIVDKDAFIDESDAIPVTPSQFEQFVKAVKDNADRAEQAESNAQGYASDSQGYAQNASESATSAHDDKIAIEQAIAEVIQQIEDFEQVQVVVNTLPPSSQATSDFTDGVLTLGIPQGVKGDTGNGIQSIAKTGTSGLVDTYTITFTDGQKTTFNVTNGAKGDTGNGIQNIAKTSTVGLVDTYTITYTDGTTTTFTVTNGEKGEKGEQGDVSLAQLYAVYPTDTASGSIASFTDGADDVPIISVVADIEPIQSGSGTPSPDNVRPISGHTECVTEVCGKNLFDSSQMLDAGTGAKFITLNLAPNTEYTMSSDDPCKSNNTITDLFFCNMDESVSSGTNGVKLNKPITRTTDSNGQLRVGYRCYEGWITPTQLASYKTQIEVGSSVTDYVPFVAPTTHTTDLGRTVYGGSVDLVSGVLTVDRAIADLGTFTWAYDPTGFFYTLGLTSLIKEDAEHQTILSSIYAITTLRPDKQDNEWADVPDQTIGAHWGCTTCPVYIYVKDSTYGSDATAFETAMDGVQLCYELATPQTYQLTPQEIDSFKGQNNLWASTGEIEVEYRADIGLYIEKKLS